MGHVGSLVGLIFFAALAMAALTSTVAALEAIVAAAIDSLGWERRRAALVSGGLCAVVGIGPALDLDLLDWMDRLAGNLLLVLGGLGLAVFTGWFMPDPMAEVSKGAEGIRWFLLWRWLLRIPVPLGLALVLYASVTRLLESPASDGKGRDVPRQRQRLVGPRAASRSTSTRRPPLLLFGVAQEVPQD
jgi:NSS family neurotransmitter:Na+ symporter